MLFKMGRRLPLPHRVEVLDQSQDAGADICVGVIKLTIALVRLFVILATLDGDSLREDTVLPV